MKFIAVSLLTVAAFAQPSLTPDVRHSVIDGAIEALNKNYVFPDVAKKMETAIRERVAKGEYDSIDSGYKLADQLTADFRAVSRDKHLGVRAARGGPDRPQGPPPPAGNEGFVKVEVMTGNIGYIDLRGFSPVSRAKSAAAAAMTLVASTDALILDLRSNGGGDAAMVAHLCSYFFEKPVHVNSIYWRPTDTTRDHWTDAEVPGRKFLNKPVWVLTSSRTFSGGEEFAYDLKTLKRATLVGETTGGGAHPVLMVPLPGGFSIGVPAGRAINPITKTNWEGTGVEPDVKVAAPDALRVAHEAALKAIRPDSAAPAVSELPQTPAGRTCAAFLAALNSGKVEEMRKFHRDRSGSEENAEKDLDLYQRSGGVEVVKVVESTNEEISLTVRFKSGGGQVNLTMTVEPAPPHGIVGLRIRG